MRVWQYFLSIGFAALLSVAPLQQGFAAGFEVHPLKIETTSGLGTLSVSNPGDVRIYIEGIIYRWSQNAEGADVLDAAPGAVVSPPAIWVEPHTEYRIRFQVPKAPPKGEGYYRILLTQIPVPKAAVGDHVMIAVT